MQEIGEESRAVQVSPLKVVDEEDDFVLFRQPREQLPQSGERAPAQLLGVRDLENASPGACHGLDAAEHGKELRERENVSREDLLGFGRRKLLQVLAEGVDQAVEGLVGDGLALVAASRQHDGAGPTRALQETARKGGLAGAGRAVQADDRGGARAGGIERGPQRGQMLAASDERRSRAAATAA